MGSKLKEDNLELNPIMDRKIIEQTKDIKNSDLKNFISNRMKYKKINKKDKILIILFYKTESIENKEEFLKTFKNLIKDSIKQYEKENLKYQIKIYTEEDTSNFYNIDMLENNKYSKGTVFVINEKVNKDTRTKFLESKQGLFYQLFKNLKIIEDNHFYDIFEYTNVDDD